MPGGGVIKKPRDEVIELYNSKQHETELLLSSPYKTLSLVNLTSGYPHNVECLRHLSPYRSSKHHIHA